MKFLIEAFMLFCLIGGALYVNQAMAKERKIRQPQEKAKP